VANSVVIVPFQAGVPQQTGPGAANYSLRKWKVVLAGIASPTATYEGVRISVVTSDPASNRNRSNMVFHHTHQYESPV